MVGPPTRVAILDDDRSVRTAIGRLLKTSHMEVDAFATSIELFNAIERKRPNCIVLDLQMPGMNGIDVMRFLTECGVHIPTIVITAHDGAALRNSCLGAGAAAYLRKPLDADELLKAIEDAVARGEPVRPTSN
jgi:FixJ family two-component response regulator